MSECECGKTFLNYGRGTAGGLKHHTALKKHLTPNGRRVVERWPELDPFDEDQELPEDKVRLVLYQGKHIVQCLLFRVGAFFLLFSLSGVCPLSVHCISST